MRYDGDMDWSDNGFVLGARRHGENALIVTLLTQDNGRCAGLVRGGASSKRRGLYQPGNNLRATWRARLADHLGTFTCESNRAHSSDFLDDPLRLLALSSATTLLDRALPEREPVPDLYEGFATLIHDLSGEDWAVAYVRWELALLADLGFGLDLTECAATGQRDRLTHVSPKSGRAVSAEAAAPYDGRLLALPDFLASGSGEPGDGDIARGLALTGYFLRRHVLGDRLDSLPPSRERLISALS